MLIDRRWIYVSETRSRRGAGPFRSEQMKVGRSRPHHQSLGKVTGRGGRAKEKEFWSFEPVEDLGGWMAARKRKENVPPHPFARRLRSMLSLVPRSTLDRSASQATLSMIVWVDSIGRGEKQRTLAIHIDKMPV